MIGSLLKLVCNLKKGRWSTLRMWRKILIINMLLVLALQPVAHAIGPIVGPVEPGQTSHDPMTMDCGHVDPNHCVDLETGVSGGHASGHASCDSKTKSTFRLPALVEHADISVYHSHHPDQYLSHHADLLLRPPRNA